MKTKLLNLVTGAALTIPLLTIAAPQEDSADAELVVQHINEADAKRVPQHINEADAKQVPQHINEIAPSAPYSRRVSVKRGARGLHASNSALKVSIPDTENEAVRLALTDGSQGVNDLVVSLPGAEKPVAVKMTSDGSVVYPNYQQDIDIAVQVFDDSARILTVLNGIGSPSEYVYHVDLPAGGRIEKDDSGGLLVLDSQDALIGGFAAPWAVDSVGEKIPTHYEVRGDLVVQVVEHLGRNTSYPVVADPWLWRDLISSASWRYISPYGYSLYVVPTRWARLFPGSYPVGVAGWNELYSKYKDRGLNVNLGGMKDQFICHQQVVAVVEPNKPSWNIDEWRPDVSYLGTVNARCNPGEPGGGKIID